MSAPMDAGACSSDDELDSSKLGTKEYWDEAYDRELQNFNDNGDTGEVWFGEDSVERVVKWIKSNNSLVPKESSILDLGCGNGIMLIELHKHDYHNLCGVDYAQAAVDLAKAIAEKEGRIITYEKPYNVCIDKGTYDAISLCPDAPAEKRAAYIGNSRQLVGDRGLLIITSCNWTQDELLKHFDQDFDLLAKIPTPTFQFGGMTGSRETALVLRKKP